MRIGIVGGTGFIGRALTRAAEARGHEVVIFSRHVDARDPSGREMRPVAVQGPVVDPSGLDALVNLAGHNLFGIWTAGRKQRIRSSRVDLTARLVEALAACPQRPRVVLNGSASGYYGSRGDDFLPESAQRGEGFLADVCVAWEAAAQPVRELGMRLVLLRTGVVLGKDGGAWPLLRRVFGFGLGGRLGDGKQWVPWIHLDDEVGLILHALENENISGPLNLVAPEPVTNAAFTKAIARAVRRPAFCHVPAFALKMLPGGFGSIVLDSTRAQPLTALNSGYIFKHEKIDGALQDLL